MKVKNKKIFFGVVILGSFISLILSATVPVYSVSAPNCVKRNIPERFSIIKGDTKEDLIELQRQASVDHALYLCLATKTYNLYIL